jgi:imidazole glycerol phosphate synthase glutamine amidotransferase subunit
VSAVRLTLIEYGGGNIPSVERAFARLGVQADRAGRPEDINENTAAIVLPGVGHFGAMLNALDANRLTAPLKQFISSGRPFLGICVGLQALFAGSEEAPAVTGLGIIGNQIERLSYAAKLPHMGWNQLRRARPSRLLAGIPDDAWFYFAHSYAAYDAGDATTAWCDHSVPFVAVLERGNWFAVQFHPEKSGDAGAKLLANFAEIVANGQASGPSVAQRVNK